ncbi:MAG: GAF domain-containing sensor histidine kinase [Desulfovermiculus sp.]
MTELQLKNNIAQVFLTVSGNAIFERVLDLLLHFFHSPYGIFGYIGQKGEFVCPAITTGVWNECSIMEKNGRHEAIVFHPEIWAGLWGRGLSECRTLISSGPFNLPSGHMSLQEVIVMPILYKKRLIGQIVLADKQYGYDNTDQAVLEGICNYLAPILRFRLEREWAREDLELAKTKAEEANLVKSQFLANMSHELRTPLHGMLGCLQLLENEQPTPECRELVQAAQQSGNVLLQLINDVLEFSSTEYADHSLKAKELNIAQELRTLERKFSSQLQAKGISLRFDISGDIPEKVVGDRTRFRQILTRLVGNAVKFSTRGPVDISAHPLHRPDTTGGHPYLRLAPNRWNILFVISDQGIGLSDDQLNTVFELFIQGDMSLSREYSGAGLGLSVVKKNVQLMHGNIAVDNSGPGMSIYLGLGFELPGM